MTLDEFQPEEDYLSAISHKMSNISMYKLPSRGEKVEKNDLATVKYLLYSSEQNKIKQSIEILRKYLVQGIKRKSGYDNNNTCAEDILSLDILPRIKELMLSDCENSIKFECTWILTNIAAGVETQTTTIVQYGFVDILLDCVKDRRCGLELNYQAAWALANIAGESSVYREELVKKGLVVFISEILEEIYEESQDDAMISVSSSGRKYISDGLYAAAIEALLWALSNLSRGGFHTADYWQSYIPMFQVFTKYLTFEIQKLEVDVCWGMSRILYNMHEVTSFHRRVFASIEVCDRLAYILRYGTTENVIPALRAVVNISSGPNVNTLGLLKSPILNSITRLLESHVPHDLRKDAFLVVSNMAAGDEETANFVISHAIVLQNVISHIKVPGHTYNGSEWVSSVHSSSFNLKEEWKVTREAVWIVFNLIAVADDLSVDRLIKQYPMLPKELAQLLNYIDLPSDTCEKTLEAMICLIQRTNRWVDKQDGKNPYVSLFLQNQTPITISTIQDNSYGRKTSLLCSKLAKLLMASEENVGHTTEIVNAANIADAFGLPSIDEIKSQSHKRRVIRNKEDGDVRLIENAVGNLSI